MKLSLADAKKFMDENDGNLDLSGSGVTALPEGLTVGGGLDLRGTGMKQEEEMKVQRLRNGTYQEGKFLYADGMLVHVKKRTKIGKYTWFTGKIPGKNVISDGTHFAHCKTLRDGIADLTFKDAKDRGAEQYRGIDIDTPCTVPELIAMYRVITGACKQGSEAFVSNLGENRKEQYTIREAIQLTKGQYNAGAFERFFLGER